MKKFKILGIAPYEGMKDMMINIASERDDIELTAYVGDLKAGAEIVKDHEKDNYDAIISRGGTALAIRKITDIAVFSITVSYYDVLNAIKLAENYDGRFAIIGFPDIADFSKQLCDILQYDIHIVTIPSEENAKSTIDSLKQQGYSLIVGDMIATQYARSIGLASMLITSGSQSIRHAFNQTVDICQHYFAFKQENIFYKMNQSVKNENIIIYKEDNSVCFSALMKDKAAIESITKRLLASLQKEKQLKTIKKMNGKTFLITGFTRSQFGSNYYIFNAIQITDIEISTFSYIKLNNKQHISHYFFSLFQNSTTHRELEHTMESYSKTDFPILITGEVGTGKDKMAQLIHANSKRDNYPCYTVECSTITQQELYDFFENKDSPFYDSHCTFYFRHIDNFSDLMLDKFFYYLKKEGFHKQNRLIFSTFISPLKSEPNFLQTYLKFQLGCLVIKLPPLRQCIDDIPGVANFYINDFNINYGKQIAGIEPEALSLLQGFLWPENLNQFKHVLTEACVLTNGPYISANTIYKLLRAESTSSITNADLNSPINLNQTLADITYDIVQAVLSKDNMTNTKAAKQLGISRTTLWRILNRS